MNQILGPFLPEGSSNIPVCCLVGAYSVRNDIFGVLVMIIFGILGYLFRKFDYEGAPLLLGFILGPMFELNLRQSLLFSKGSFLIFFTRPISAVAITIAIILLIYPLISIFVRRKKNANPPIAGH